MSVNIDELQVETQPPASAPPAASAGPATEGKLDIRVELERMRERELRLRAD